MSKGIAVITGASSGIGAATAELLAADGFEVVLGARREERLADVAALTGGTAHRLDVTDAASIAEFRAAVSECRVLINNAGGALGMDPVVSGDLEQWRWMYEANVLGTVAMIQSFYDLLESSGDGHIVNIGSIAGFEAYPGGGGYNAAKFALDAVTKVLRQELLGKPIRVTEIDPGMTETEFSLVRFDGDAERADAVYTGLEPLTAHDVAETIAFAVGRPSHVNIDRIVVRTRDQATATMFNRRPS